MFILIAIVLLVMTIAYCEKVEKEIKKEELKVLQLREYFNLRQLEKGEIISAKEAEKDEMIKEIWEEVKASD
ncbi:MAG: hypothetical protein J6U54_15940 [Clostridiales bacterium]|nr:hypothetical protein [Clostridiales bacterium]